MCAFISNTSCACRKFLYLRFCRCVLPPTSRSSHKAPILTASSSSPALCATLWGRTPTPSPLYPLATPRLSLGHLPRPTWCSLTAALGGRWRTPGRAPFARLSCPSFSRMPPRPKGTHLTVSWALCRLKGWVRSFEDGLCGEVMNY